MKRQPTPDEQDIIDELEVTRLQKQLAILKKLPKDFRDMEVMSSGWQSFAEIMGPEKKTEMLEWAKGGVLCLAPINDLERKVLAGHGKVLEYKVLYSAKDILLEPAFLEDILATAKSCKVSFIYALEWPKHVITSLNWLASHFGWNFRFLGQLKGEGGHALGL